MELAQVFRAIGQSELSLEDRLRNAVRAARLEMSPAWIEALRVMPAHIKIAQANALFCMGREALYQQELRKGLSPAQARAAAGARMLNQRGW